MKPKPLKQMPVRNKLNRSYKMVLPPGAKLSDIFMDGQQVVQELHISKRTLQNWRSTGKIPYSREFGKIFYYRQQIAAILLRGVTES